MAAAKVSYLDFLNLLLGLGANIGPAISLIKQLVEQFAVVVDMLGKLGQLLKPPAESPATPGGAAPAAPATPAAPSTLAVQELSISQVERDAELKLLALCNQNKVHVSKLGDGTLLRAAFQFLQAHPELLTMLLGVLKGGA